MKLAIGSDHAGFALKELLKNHLTALGATIVDVGTGSEVACDYPDFAEKVAIAVANQQVDRGIMICGSGVGASIAINKVPGIRGGLCHDHYSAHQGVEHDHMNVLVLGARIIGTEVAKELVEAFMHAQPSSDPRHLRRLSKVKAIEVKYLEGEKS